jgi:hypothetical protein
MIFDDFHVLLYDAISMWTIQSRMVGWWMNDELEGICTEADAT